MDNDVLHGSFTYFDLFFKNNFFRKIQVTLKTMFSNIFCSCRKNNVLLLIMAIQAFFFKVKLVFFEFSRNEIRILTSSF